MVHKIATFSDVVLDRQIQGIISYLQQNAIGLHKVNPAGFGATPGPVSDAVRTLNTAAINEAFAEIRGVGSLDISGGPWEVNGSLLFGSLTQIYPQKTSVVGDNSDSSQIISYATGTVMDAVGLNNLKLNGITITALAAEVGLLLGRASAGVAPGAWASMNHVNIHGSYSKASLVTIASEIMFASDCFLANSYADANVYMTSTGNDTIDATSAYAPLYASSNTDIRFLRTTFWTSNTGQANLWAESQLDASFIGCDFINENPDSTNKLVRLIANTGDIFNGKLNFRDCLFESAYATAFYLDYAGASGNFYDISVTGSDFNLFYTGHKLIDYKDVAHQTMFNIKWDDNKYGALLTNKAMIFPLFTQYLELNAPPMNLVFNGDTQFSNIKATAAAWNSGSLLSGVMDVATSYNSSIPTKGVFPLYQHVTNSTPAVGQPKGWYCTSAGGAKSTTRANTTAYSLGVWALWTTGTTIWEVTTAGTSAGSAPSIAGKVVGDTVVDGTVTWTMRSTTTAVLTSEGNL